MEFEQTVYPGDLVMLDTDGKFYRVEAISNNMIYIRSPETWKAFWIRRDNVRSTTGEMR